ncbi:Hypothetical predicted protein [Pelobates cultripes]|uniref:Uncharacterized protein n=1 Tax=Pelobates cultripes TaxID=61616 RepID=A0AAD1RZ28_PELCU|nr:Hypothetical predicted protein [Pelobates cultripes]
MSDLPDLAVSAELKAWLYNALADSIPKALAAFSEQTVPAPMVTITQLSDSEESHGSDRDEVPLKRPWKGDSATAGKGKAPAKHRRVSLSKPREVVSQHDFDPLEGSTSNYNLQVVDEFYAQATGLDPQTPGTRAIPDSTTGSFSPLAELSENMDLLPYAVALLQVMDLTYSHIPIAGRLTLFPQKWS